MRHRFIILLFFLYFGVSAQEQLGLRLENYAGVSSLSINPTGHLFNKLNWDINLAGASIFMENNYFFFENTNNSRFFNASEDALFFSRPEIGNDTKVGNEDFVVDYFDKSKKHFAAVGATIMGPSIAIKLNNRHSVGIFTNVRVFGSIQNAPSELGYYQYNPFPRNEEMTLAPFNAAAISWKEIGFNYALKIPTATGSIGFGVNVRFLRAMEGAFAKSSTTIRHQKFQNDVRLFEAPDFRYGYTNSNLQGEDYAIPKNNGSGYATDLGFTYTIEEDEDNYKLKLGASIIDLGFLSFDDNSIDFLIQVDTSVTLDWADYEGFSSTEDFKSMVRQLSDDAYDNPFRAIDGTDFQVLLPAAFSLQADYSFHPNIYLNALLVQRIGFKGVIAERGNLFALTPRFEHRWLSASLPISIYNWQNVNVGLAARLAYLVIGTDNLGSWISKSKWTGTDFYFALKFNLSELGFEGGGYANKKRRKRGKVKCYTF